MSGTDIVALPEADAPKTDAPNRILINFPDDHDIHGAKIEIVGVTSEQIMLAVFYLTRSANQLADARQMQGEMQRREIENISRELRKGH